MDPLSPSLSIHYYILFNMMEFNDLRLSIQNMLQPLDAILHTVPSKRMGTLGSCPGAS